MKVGLMGVGAGHTAAEGHRHPEEGPLPSGEACPEQAGGGGGVGSVKVQATDAGGRKHKPRGGTWLGELWGRREPQAPPALPPPHLTGTASPSTPLLVP